MFDNRRTKWSKWYDSLPEHTKTYLKNQPIWHDKDLVTFCSVAFVFGFLIGCAIGALK